MFEQRDAAFALFGISPKRAEGRFVHQTMRRYITCSDEIHFCIRRAVGNRKKVGNVGFQKSACTYVYELR